MLLLCKCGKAIDIPETHRGQKIRCRSCGRIMRAGQQQRRVARVLAGAFGSVVSVAARLGAPPPTMATTRRPYLRVAARATWAYFFAVIVVAIVFRAFADAWWPATVILFFGRWVFLLPLAALIPAAVVLRRTLLLPLALAALIVAGPIMGFSLGLGRFSSHAEGLHVRVMTFNAGGGQFMGGPQLAVMLEDLQVDVAAFQECGADLVETVRTLAGWFHHDVRGLCTLSRYPILDSAVMDRAALQVVKLNEEAGIGGSGDVARFAIQTPRGVFHFTNLHLETPRKGLEGIADGEFNLGRLRANTTLRSVESELARRWVNAGGAPALVAGDFNTPVESRIYRRYWGDLINAHSRAGFGLGMTRFNGWIRVRIDHVLSGPGWFTDSVRVGEDLGSDHRPLIVDLTLVAGSR